MKNIVIKIFVGMVMLFSATACFGSNEGAPSNCSQAEMDWFWKDLEDGSLDYPHECGANHHAPDPSDNGFNIDAPEPKMPACNMHWSLEWNVPAYGPYNLNWTPQNGAISYEVVITGPNGEQTVLKSSSSDLVMMMQDFPEGNYTYEVRATDLYGNYICSITTNFDKPVADVPAGNGSVQPLMAAPNNQEKNSEEQEKSEQPEQHVSEPPQPEPAGFIMIVVPPNAIEQPIEPPK